MSEEEIIKGLDIVINNNKNKVFMTGKLNYVVMAESCKIKILDLQNQLQQKENIIKEAIEYHDNCVDNSLDLDKIDENERLAYKVAYEIHDNYLNILKGENNE